MCHAFRAGVVDPKFLICSSSTDGQDVWMLARTLSQDQGRIISRRVYRGCAGDGFCVPRLGIRSRIRLVYVSFLGGRKCKISQRITTAVVISLLGRAMRAASGMVIARWAAKETGHAAKAWRRMRQKPGIEMERISSKSSDNHVEDRLDSSPTNGGASYFEVKSTTVVSRLPARPCRMGQR
jgi:hypothetical protein